MTIQLDTIVLPDELTWSDEFAWSATVQQQTYTLSGALIVEESTTTAGRPISLTSSGAAVVTRAQLKALKAKEALAGEKMTLTIWDGRRFSVIWRRDPLGITTTPFIDYADPDDDALYEINLNFTVIEELN